MRNISFQLIGKNFVKKENISFVENAISFQLLNEIEENFQENNEENIPRATRPYTKRIINRRRIHSWYDEVLFDEILEEEE